METGLAVISLRHVSVLIPYKCKLLSYPYLERFWQNIMDVIENKAVR